MRNTPFWLRSEDEVREPLFTADRPSRFVLASVEALMRLGCNFQQAVAVAAVAVAASAWGLFAREHNYVGVTLTRDRARPGLRWFRSSDAFLAAFPTLEGFYAHWLQTYAPRTADGKYGAVGSAFWANEYWFDALRASGYVAETTAPDPRLAPEPYEDLWGQLATMWVQDKIGTDPDGVWGRLSEVALQRWAARSGYRGEPEMGMELVSHLTSKKEPGPPMPPIRLVTRDRIEFSDDVVVIKQEAKETAPPAPPSSDAETVVSTPEPEAPESVQAPAENPPASVEGATELSPPAPPAPSKKTGRR